MISNNDVITDVMMSNTTDVKMSNNEDIISVIINNNVVTIG